MRIADPRRLRADRDRSADGRARLGRRSAPVRWGGRCPGCHSVFRTASSCWRIHSRIRPSSSAGLMVRPAPEGSTVAHGRWACGPTRTAICTSRGGSDDVIISAGYRVRALRGGVPRSSRTAPWPRRLWSRPPMTSGEPWSGQWWSCVRGSRPALGAGDRAPGTCQARDRAVQIPPDRRVRGGAAQDGQRQGPTSPAPGGGELGFDE